MLLQIDHTILHFLQNLDAFLVVQAPDDPKRQVCARIEPHGIPRLRTMDLVELVVMPLKDRFGFEQTILKGYLPIGYICDSNI